MAGLTGVLEKASTIVGDAFRRLVTWMRPRQTPVPTTLVVMTFATTLVLAAWFIVDSYRNRYGKEIEIYTGPPGASSWRTADDIEAAILQERPAPFVQYRVSQKETQGFDHIQRLLAKDTSGRRIGFGTEAIAVDIDAPTVLLPLDWDYLHILCSRKLVEDLGCRSSDKQPLSLREVLYQLQKQNRSDDALGTMYVGPELSATRRFAEWVLEKYGFDVDDCAAPGIANWKEARLEVKRHKINFLFYCGPLGSTTVAGLARDTILLSIDDTCDAICSEHELRIWPAVFPRNSYRGQLSESRETGVQLGTFAELKGSDDGADKAAQGDQAEELPFCPKGVKTLSSRRLLICSATMSNTDAYIIASAVRKTLPATIAGSWRSSPAEQPGDVRPTGEIVLPIHPGAVHVKEGKPLVTNYNPLTWPVWLQTIGLMIISGLLTEWNRRATSRPLEFSTIITRIEDLYAHVRDSRRSDMVRNRERWMSEAFQLEKELLQIYIVGDVLEKEFESRRGQLKEIRGLIVAELDDHPSAPSNVESARDPSPEIASQSKSSATAEA